MLLRGTVTVSHVFQVCSVGLPALGNHGALFVAAVMTYLLAGPVTPSQVMEQTGVSATTAAIPDVIGAWAISLTSLDEVFVRVIAAAEREREAVMLKQVHAHVK